MASLIVHWRNWRERRAILHDIRREQLDNRERSQFEVRDHLEEALAVLEANDRRKAAQIWTKTFERHPNEVRKSPLALEVLLKLEQFDEAEALMREGRKKHPREARYAAGIAKVARARGDYDQAIKYYATLRTQFPSFLEGYSFGAETLATVGRLEEAEALASQTIQRFPEDIEGFLEYARAATHREDWIEALNRWQIVQGKFSDRSFGYTGSAQAMIKLGYYDDADRQLTSACVRFPTDSEIFAELARCATARGDTSAATARWQRRNERFPLELHGYWDTAKALQQLGQTALAEAILRAAIDRFPDEPRPRLELASLLRNEPT